MLSPEEIKANAAVVEERIAAACDRAGRRRDEVILVAVTKTFPAEVVQSAIDAGLQHIGENRVQEARDKRPVVHGSATWHLIGHLQSNKAKDAVKLFDIIQTIDSLELAQKVAKAAVGAGKVQDVLVEVNVGDEPQKSGVLPADVENVVKEIAGIQGLRVRGLMSIPPIGPVEETRKHFRTLRALRDRLGLEQLSMGMSEDFEAAIEEGSTMVRVGRAIFGPRG